MSLTRRRHRAGAHAGLHVAEPYGGRGRVTLHSTSEYTSDTWYLFTRPANTRATRGTRVKISRE